MEIVQCKRENRKKHREYKRRQKKKGRDGVTYGENRRK